ncbi:MAG: TonB-dependent receptor [Deltaproteobacteria bacterium]|nr:TonB-dependent receptor [Deltaproteobacteria bacterium]
MTPAPVARVARKVCARTSGLPSRSFALLLALACPLFAGAEQAEPPAPPTIIRDAGEVSVVATRGERNLLDVPAHVTVLDRAAIERSGAASLPELLRGEAGIGVSNTTTNAEGYTVEARGFLNGAGSGCRTLVLVDGRRANEPDSGCVDWTFLGLDQIERVEVIRGTGSAAYGDNALGGVIAIFTRGASAEGGTLAALSAERASFDAERASALVSQRFGALRVGASAAFDDTSGYRARSDLNNKRAGVDVAWELADGGELGLSAGYASSERSRPGALDAGTDPRSTDPTTLDFAREREGFVRGALDLELPYEWRMQATPYYRHSKARNHFENPFFTFDSEADNDSAGVDLQLSRDLEVLGKSVRLLGGAELRQDDIDVASSFAKNDARRRVCGVFVQAESWLRDDVLLSFGLRRDRSDLEGRSTQFPGTRFDKEHALWSPRASLTWRFHENGSAYVSYGRGFRFPNVDETFGFFGFSPTLSPERAHSVETGASWRSERFELRGALYAMWVEDEMFFDPFSGFGQNVNLDEVRHEGAELSGRVALLDWLHASASYTRDDVKVTRDSVGSLEGEQLPITPKNRGQLALEAELPLGIEARLAGTFVGDRRVANDPLGSVADLDGYATLDAHLAYTRDLAPGLAFTLEANGRNLTGSDYADFAGYSIFSFPPATRFYPAAQANWSVGARIRFER